MGRPCRMKEGHEANSQQEPDSTAHVIPVDPGLYLIGVRLLQQGPTRKKSWHRQTVGLEWGSVNPGEVRFLRADSRSPIRGLPSGGASFFSALVLAEGA